jgi:hypothetical protein
VRASREGREWQKSLRHAEKNLSEEVMESRCSEKNQTGKTTYPRHIEQLHPEDIPGIVQYFSLLPRVYCTSYSSEWYQRPWVCRQGESKRKEKGKKNAILSIADGSFQDSWGEVEGLPSSGLVLLHHIFALISELSFVTV